jgi:EAL domain-containing protein (putative c-di-GMP-specific phosphodiesterase class I)
VALAEGVETEAEAQICKQMGFDLCQGYLTGRPEIV